MPASFPTAIVTSLKEAVNNLSCDLEEDVLIDDSIISVISTEGCPVSSSFHMENEIIYYTNKTATTFTGCTRGEDGTIAVAHLKILGGEIRFGPEAHHINQLNEEVVAIETIIGTTLTRSKLIIATRVMTAASGDVIYTGVGFPPTSIICIGVIGNTYSFFIGFADSAKSGAEIDPWTSANAMSDSGAFLVIHTGASNSQQAIVKTYNANGSFTLTWTKTGSPTGTATLKFLCFR